MSYSSHLLDVSPHFPFEMAHACIKRSLLLLTSLFQRQLTVVASKVTAATHHQNFAHQLEKLALCCTVKKRRKTAHKIICFLNHQLRSGKEGGVTKREEWKKGEGGVAKGRGRSGKREREE